MNLKELEAKYEELGNEIERLKLKKEQNGKPDILWEPETGCDYFLLSCGGVFKSHQDGRAIHHGRYERKQLFKTLEEAERADRQRIAKMKVLRRVAELNHEKGWVCDWKCEGQKKHLVRIHYFSMTIHILSFWSEQTLPTTHYAAKGVWEQVIEEMGDDVKLGLWGIE